MSGRAGPSEQPTAGTLARRALAVWLLLMAVESAHGTLRTLLVESRLGEALARRVALVPGALLLLLVTWLTIRWLGARTPRALWAIGLLWAALTLLFELGLGRLVLGYPWERLLSDYDLPAGGLMGLGLAFLAACPYLAARLRGLVERPDAPA